MYDSYFMISSSVFSEIAHKFSTPDLGLLFALIYHYCFIVASGNLTGKVGGSLMFVATGLFTIDCKLCCPSPPLILVIDL